MFHVKCISECLSCICELGLPRRQCTFPLWMLAGLFMGTLRARAAVLNPSGGVLLLSEFSRTHHDSCRAWPVGSCLYPLPSSFLLKISRQRGSKQILKPWPFASWDRRVWTTTTATTKYVFFMLFLQVRDFPNAPALGRSSPWQRRAEVNSSIFGSSVSKRVSGSRRRSWVRAMRVHGRLTC